MGMPLDVVILATDPPEGVAKAYYAKAFSPKSTDAPDCASSNGKFPDSFFTSPVSPSCADCKFNVFGTSKNSQGEFGKGKACSDFKHMFVVFPHDIGGQIYCLRIPATSLKALSAYGRHLRDSAVPPQCLVTRLTFSNETHPQLEFNGIEWLAEDQAGAAMARVKSPELQGLLPSKDSATGPTAVIRAPAEQGTAPALPSPVTRTMTEKAKGAPYADFVSQNWTDEALIEQGYMLPPEPVAPPSGPVEVPIPPPPTPIKTMTAKAGGVPYADHIAKGWTDDQLIANGYMEMK